MRNLVLFIATGAGSGYFPVAPGTVGSGVGVCLFAVAAGLLALPLAALLGIAVVLSALGVWAASRAESLLQSVDDGRITIDEMAGMWISLVGLPPRLSVWVVGFVLFRIFDILKPPPLRRLESLHGGWGIMADDLAAGVYANLVGQLLWRVIAVGEPGGWP